MIRLIFFYLETSTTETYTNSHTLPRPEALPILPGVFCDARERHRLDGARYEEGSDQEGRNDRRRRRLSRKLARLRQLQRQCRQRLCDRGCGTEGRICPSASEDRQTDGQGRMVDDPADGQCGQPAGAERAELPRRDHTAALLQQQGRSGLT